MKIGFFDSGKGGLLIANAVREFMPHYDYVYYGDTANVPYGDKTEAEVYDLTKAALTQIFALDCAIAVVACNTASVESLHKIQTEWLLKTYPNRKVLGVVIPTIETLADQGVSKAILLATKRTVASQKYDKELSKIPETNLELIHQPASKIVPAIERGDIEDAVKIASEHISDHIKFDTEIDSVILGCTHYSLIVGELRARFPNLVFFAQTEIIPNRLEMYLGKHEEIKSTLSTNSTFEQILTGVK